MSRHMAPEARKSGSSRERGEAAAATPKSAAPKHTPGPWFLSRTMEQVESAGPSIARVIYGTRHESLAEFAANARLIAAAPDLLAACRLALATHSLSESEPGGPKLSDVSKALRAAISKAEGAA